MGRQVWAIFRPHWWRWIGLGLIALGPPMLLEALLPDYFGDPFDPFQLRWDLLEFVMLMTSLSWLYLWMTLTGGGAILTARILDRQPVSLVALLRPILRRAGLFVGGNLLAGLLVEVIIRATIKFMALSPAPLILNLLAYGFVLYVIVVWFPPLNPVLALERGGLFRLLRRAWSLGRKRFKVNLGLMILMLAVPFMATAPITAIQNKVLASPLGYGPEGWGYRPDYWPWLTFFMLLSLLVQSVVVPCGAILNTLLYFEARARLDSPDERRSA